MGRAGFERTGITTAEWKIAGPCLSPVPVEMNGAPSRIAGNGRQRKPGHGFTLLLHTRCRKCPPCLKARRNLWAARARAEIEGANGRTWFATFTLNPVNRFMVLARASARLSRGGTDINTLSEPDRFEELAREFGAEMTKYLKRLRQNTGAPFRYILVAERHKDGTPHFHALFHEQTVEHPLRHATLAAGFMLGYTNFKLCEGSEAAWYVAKYLAKSAETRVRASLGYGQPPSVSEEITPLWPSAPTGQRENPRHTDKGSVATPQENSHEVPSASVLPPGPGRDAGHNPDHDTPPGEPAGGPPVLARQSSGEAGEGREAPFTPQTVRQTFATLWAVSVALGAVPAAADWSSPSRPRQTGNARPPEADGPPAAPAAAVPDAW